eukprot:4520288-Prymnesium_polylepis.1
MSGCGLAAAPCAGDVDCIVVDRRSRSSAGPPNFNVLATLLSDVLTRCGVQLYGQTFIEQR